MFERFFREFGAVDGADFEHGRAATTLDELLDRAGGTSFAQGLYRLHTKSSARASNRLVQAAFPEFGRRFTCFGYDWLGRQFALDSSRGLADDAEILLFEPGTGEALEIPVAFSQFHNMELVDYTEEALARDFFSEWRRRGGSVPNASQCVGYRRPLFLGGKDDVANLELSDLDVYWIVMGQLRQQAKGLPEGTRIGEVFGH